MREDRHGRTTRADNDRRRRPFDGFRLRDSGRFARLVEDTLATLPDPLLEALEDAELVVDDVPPSPAGALDEIPLVDFRPARSGRPARVRVYRRPLEGRAYSRAELAELVRSAVGSEVAGQLGLDVDLDDEEE